MKKEETCKEKCTFTILPCKFNVNIREIKPFFVCACQSILLDLKVINRCNASSCISIISKPKFGKVCLFGPSTIVYKSTKRRPCLDLFQILVEDEFGGKSTETILIRVI